MTDDHEYNFLMNYEGLDTLDAVMVKKLNRPSTLSPTSVPKHSIHTEDDHKNISL